MNRITKVRLRWLVNAASAEFPRGKRFSRPARFKHQEADWASDAWSLVIEAENVPDATGEQVATARFLVDDAPQAWLAIGKRFTLFEGDLRLAEGVVEEILGASAEF